jgi:mRNA-degrading endonuclease toxin of MazEF toxin-antitoxin module
LLFQIFHCAIEPGAADAHLPQPLAQRRFEFGRAGFPLALELSAPKLPKRSWIKISQIRTLSVERVGGRLGRCTPEVLAQVVEGLNELVAG